MPFTDKRMEEHVAGLKAKTFAFGRGEPNAPSAEDLDLVAEEVKTKEATKPKAGKKWGTAAAKP